MTEFQNYTLDSKNQRISVCRDTKDFSNQQGRGKFQVGRDKMLGALHLDGKLLLVCEVEYLPPNSKITVEEGRENDTNDEQGTSRFVEISIRDSLREMLENELFTDCAIQVIFNVSYSYTYLRWALKPTMLIDVYWDNTVWFSALCLDKKICLKLKMV